ncbi:MAG: amidohydrolase [Acidaminobacteraceae bacterium]
MNILIRDTNILTMESEEIIKGNIGIVDSEIAFCGVTPYEFIPDEVIDGQGTITMPGLINAHTHAAMSLMRNYADDLPFWPWLTEKIWPIEEKLTGDHVYHGTMLSIVEMIRSGITTFADMYMFMDEVAKAVEITGIRANLSRGIAGSASDIKSLAKLKESEEFFNKYNNSSDGRIKVDLGPHAPYTCDKEYLLHVIELAKKLDARLHIHLSESKKEVEDSYKAHGMSPIQYMNELGLFECKTMAAHCVHIDDKDIAILKEKNVSVLNNPGSNMKLANGFSPVSKLLDSGVNVALGTDGSASNNNLNMFEEMNYASLVNKATTFEPTAVPAFKALQMATINGAIALGIDDKVGTITAGKKADLIMIDIEKAHFYPKYNLISSLVYSAQASDVMNVIINGKVIMQDYKITTVNEKEILINSDKYAKNLTMDL